MNNKIREQDSHGPDPLRVSGTGPGPKVLFTNPIPTAHLILHFRPSIVLQRGVMGDLKGGAHTKHCFTEADIGHELRILMILENGTSAFSWTIEVDNVENESSAYYEWKSAAFGTIVDNTGLVLSERCAEALAGQRFEVTAWDDPESNDDPLRHADLAPNEPPQDHRAWVMSQEVGRWFFSMDAREKIWAHPK